MARVFHRMPYLCIACGTACIIFALIAWTPDKSVLLSILSEPNYTLPNELYVIVQLLWASLFELQPVDFIYAGVLSAFIGINTAMLLFYYRMHNTAPAQRTGIVTGVSGMVAGLLGFGCAACGSLFATGLISAIGGASLAASLPFNGPWFQATGICLLLFSTWWLARAINKPAVCPI